MCKWEVSQPMASPQPGGSRSTAPCTRGYPQGGLRGLGNPVELLRRCIGSGLGNLCLEYDRGEDKAKTP